MPRIKQSDPEDIKKFVETIYPMLLEAYKFQAGYEPCGNVFSIGMNRMNAFMGEDGLNCLDAEGEGNM